MAVVAAGWWVVCYVVGGGCGGAVAVAGGLGGVGLGSVSLVGWVFLWPVSGWAGWLRY